MLRAAISILLLLAACAPAESSNVYSRSDAGHDASTTTRTRMLVIETDEQIHLRYLERAELRVRLTDLTGAPIPNTPIEFALFNGQSIDLGDTSLITDTQGRVSKTIIAGQDDANASIRVTTEGAAGVLIDVQVRPAGAASLNVTTVYDGARAMNLWFVDVFEGRTCRDAIAIPSGDKSQRIESTSLPSFRFLGLASHTSYATRVRGLNQNAPSRVLATGCIESASLDSNIVTNIEVSLADTPVIAGDSVPVTITLSAAQAAIAAHNYLDVALWDHAADSARPSAARWLLTQMTDHVQDATRNGAAWAELIETTDFVAMTQLALDNSDSGPRNAMAGLDDLLSRTADDIAIDGTLQVIDGAPVFTPTLVALVDPDSGARVELVSLSTSITATSAGTFDAPNMRAMFSALNFQLPLSALVQAVLRPPVFVTDGSEDALSVMLIEHSGCEALAEVGETIVPEEVCDLDCLLASCRLVYAQTQTRMELATSAIGADYAQVQLVGEARALDDDADGTVDHYDASETGFSGSWTGATSAPPFEVRAYLSQPVATP